MQGTNLDDMETSTFVTDQFLTNVRDLIGFAIEAVHNGMRISLILLVNYKLYYYLKN